MSIPKLDIKEKRNKVFSLRLSQNELTNIKNLSDLKKMPINSIIAEMTISELQKINSDQDDDHNRLLIANNTFAKEWNLPENDVWDNY